MIKGEFNRLEVGDKLYSYNGATNTINELIIESKKHYEGEAYYSYDVTLIDGAGTKLKITFADAMFYGLNGLSAIDAYININQKLIDDRQASKCLGIDIEKLEGFVANALELKRQLLENRAFDNLRDCKGNIIQEGDCLKVAKSNADDCFRNPVAKEHLFVCKGIGIEPITNKNKAILVNVKTHYIYSLYSEELVEFEKEW